MSERYDLFIIDDSPSVSKKIISILSKYDIKIKAFSDPVEGINELTATPPRVVFIDYNMPILDGKNFIVKMSERYLFQFCSAYLITSTEFDEVATTQLRTLGFTKIIQKPFTENDLVSALSLEIGELKLK